jgi:hypothetical protein
MKNVWARTLCRLLMVLMIWSPVQFAQAGMIGTDQLVANAVSNVQADRTTVTQFLGRAEVTSQLQSLGLDPATAASRVAALSDQEVQQLAGKINSLPAGGDGWGVVILLVVIGAVVWYIWFRK